MADPTTTATTNPPPQTTTTTTHFTIASFLIATVSILGISFLVLTTCTIILRRRRTVSPPRLSNHQSHVDHHSFNDQPIWHVTNTVGLEQSVIDSITCFKYKTNNDSSFSINDCSVCLTEFEDGDHLRLLPKCNHVFHVSCIDVWFSSHQNCPVCRAFVVCDLVDESEINNDDGCDSNETSRVGLRVRDPRVCSDLGQNFRFTREDVETIKRSISFNCLGGVDDQGSSSNNGVDENKTSVEKLVKWGSTTMNGLFKSSSLGRLSNKGPVSIKRSFSSGGKLFSFRRTKNQASILPL